MKKNETIDYNFTLLQTEEACEQVQRGNFQLENISYGIVEQDSKKTAVNKASFQRKSSDLVLNDLKFIEVGNGNADTITQSEKKNGYAPICDGEIYISKKLSRILVFGKVA